MSERGGADQTHEDVAQARDMREWQNRQQDAHENAQCTKDISMLRDVGPRESERMHERRRDETHRNGQDSAESANFGKRPQDIDAARCQTREASQAARRRNACILGSFSYAAKCELGLKRTRAHIAVSHTCAIG